MYERDVLYYTNEDKSLVLPKTNRGKVRKLTYSVICSLEGYGNYFFFSNNETYEQITIGNYKTQRTYYKENTKGINNIEELKLWCDNFVKNSTLKDLEEVKEFASAKRQHVKYCEGDYFKAKLGRHLYTYGRIIMDISKYRKEGLPYWNVLMGKPLIIEMFLIITNKDDVTIKELEDLPTFPTQHILDNNFYYGDYEIIGNKALPKKIKYPIMYSKSILGTNPNKIIFQCGKIYKEIDYNDNLITKDNQDILNNFRNNSIGYNINVNEEIIRNCLKDNSLRSYWGHNYSNAKWDLRSPENKEYLKKVLEQFGLG